ncbi:MAG TPA: hypothetical protein VGF38_03685 [Ktedonobacterales bacterium]|jgi:hypothetical protein
MSSDPRNIQPAQPDDIRAAHVKRAVATLQQATTNIHAIFREIKAGELRVTAAEAASMQMELQELVLQAAALGGIIREQQTGQGQLHPLR